MSVFLFTFTEPLGSDELLKAVIIFFSFTTVFRGFVSIHFIHMLLQIYQL